MQTAVTTTAVSAVWVRVTLGFEMFDARLVLTVDDARAPRSNAAGQAITKAAAEAVAPFTLAFGVVWLVLRIAVSSSDHGHARGSRGLLGIHWLLVLFHFVQSTRKSKGRREGSKE